MELQRFIWQRNFWQEETEMKKYIKKYLRPTLFVLGGALVGLGYYAVVGCSSGSCAIASNHVNSMAYMGLVGGLLSVVMEPKSKDNAQK